MRVQKSLCALVELKTRMAVAQRPAVAAKSRNTHLDLAAGQRHSQIVLLNCRCMLSKI